MTLNPQQFQQLPMFMSGREIMEQTQPRDFDRNDAAAGYAAKIADADKRMPGTAWSIRNDGVRQPVAVDWLEHGQTPLLMNGHHRVALSHQADPDRLIPVEHGEYYPFALKRRMREWKG